MNEQAAGPFFFPGGDRGALLLHGFSGTAFEMRALGERLSREGFTVSVPLLPGHGTDPRDLLERTPDDFLAAAERAHRALSERCRATAVVGFSLGAFLALELAAGAPERVRALAVLSPPYHLSGSLGVLLWLYSFTPIRRVLPMFPKFASEGEIRDPVWRGRAPGYGRLPLKKARELREYFLRMRKDPPRVACPVLLAHGVHDGVVPISGARELARRLGPGRCRELYLPHSAHLIPLDLDRHLLEDRVAEFLTEVL